jgi:branched-chain amino acid transport system ATP-binding protein
VEAAAPILSLKGVRKSFGALAAVDDVSFDVPEGSIFGIAGPNGAGKTTLFNVITGVPFGPDAGEVWFRGTNIASTPAHRRCRLGLARTFQADASFRTLTVEQTLELAVDFGSDRNRHARKEHVESLVQRLQLARYRHDVAGDLPLFVKKLVVIGSALASDPLILLLDEPAAGLSHREVTELAEVVRTVHSDGRTVILIEHVLPFLLGISSQVMVMNHGAVLAHGSPQQILGNRDVVEAYLGERGRRMVDAVVRAR